MLNLYAFGLNSRGAVLHEPSMRTEPMQSGYGPFGAPAVEPPRVTRCQLPGEAVKTEEELDVSVVCPKLINDVMPA